MERFPKRSEPSAPHSRPVLGMRLELELRSGATDSQRTFGMMQDYGSGEGWKQTGRTRQ